MLTIHSRSTSSQPVKTANKNQEDKSNPQYFIIKQRSTKDLSPLMKIPSTISTKQELIYLNSTLDFLSITRIIEFTVYGQLHWLNIYWSPKMLQHI